MPSIPTITAAAEAESLLRELATDHDWVSVFWDRGWGDSGQATEISIIVDGNGNQPRASLTKDVYRQLITAGTVGEDTYAGYKARRIHDYKVPPEPEKIGPTPNEVAEGVLRGLFANNPDLPLKTAFFRGINTGNRRSPFHNPINEDVLTTEAFGRGNGYVNISPGAGEAYISAWTSGYFGDRIRDGVTVHYPRGTEPNGYGGLNPDVAAMRGSEFADELLAAIRSQLTLLGPTPEGKPE